MAHETVSLYRLSGGWLVLGVGIGGGDKERADLGEHWHLEQIRQRILQGPPRID